jgi:hypothetical protein
MKPAALIDNVAASLREADEVAATHFPGHEAYAVESYLSAIAWMLLAQYAERHNLVVPGEITT